MLSRFTDELAWTGRNLSFKLSQQQFHIQKEIVSLSINLPDRAKNLTDPVFRFVAIKSRLHSKIK